MDAIVNNVIVNEILVLSKPALFNIYFAFAAIPLGFPVAVGLCLLKASENRVLSCIAGGYIYAFRSSPLFIQLFMFYSLCLSLNLDYWKPIGIDHIVLNPLFLGPFVLALNTSAYTAEILYGAMRSVPKEQIDAAKSLGMNKLQMFRTIVWPNMIRLAWPAYTNEVVFMFHATALIYFALPVIDDNKDLMNKAGEMFERDYNVFLHYSVAAMYFLIISMLIIYVFQKVYQRLISHLYISDARKRRIEINPDYMR